MFTHHTRPQEAPRGGGDGEPRTEAGQEQELRDLTRARAKGMLGRKGLWKRVDDSSIPLVSHGKMTGSCTPQRVGCSRLGWEEEVTVA